MKILNELNCTGKKSKLFWKTLNKLNDTNNDEIFKSGISADRWTGHFKSVFCPVSPKPFPINPSEEGSLDYAIEEEELLKATYILRPGKTPGVDGISNEMLLCLLGTNPKMLQKLFNNILSSSTPIKVWDTSLINPIHKKGSKMDPDNYRAISLLCCLGKLFSAILNNRLLKFAI